jgi:hypothetical protein
MAKPNPATMMTDKIGAKNTDKKMKVFLSYFSRYISSKAHRYSMSPFWGLLELD